MFAKLKRSLHHLFAPHSGNNFRAKLLHNSGLVSLLGIFLTLNLLIRIFDSTPLHILGFTSSVTIDEVVAQTNVERTAAGLSTLRYNETLADAARRKAANMFSEDYWAHTSPSGLSPWHWFSEAGYNYTHAGENLAKDFGSTDRMVAAWMDSPTHRENIVNPLYSEIGVAVVPGTLLGQETVLVVQLFGSRQAGSITPSVSEVTPSTQGVSTAKEVPLIAQIESQPDSSEVIPSPAPTTTPAPTPVELNSSLSNQAANTPPTRLALFDEFNLEKSVSVITTILLLLVLILDLVVAESRKLSRRVGKNWAHIAFINVILILVTLVQAGRIL